VQESLEYSSAFHNDIKSPGSHMIYTGQESVPLPYEGTSSHTHKSNARLPCFPDVLDQAPLITAGYVDLCPLRVLNSPCKTPFSPAPLKMHVLQTRSACGCGTRTTTVSGFRARPVSRDRTAAVTIIHQPPPPAATCVKHSTLGWPLRRSFVAC
jgi:hypothetical protein